MNIFVGNLNFRTSEDQLTALFAPLGEINSVKIITDMHTGRSKGFGFVDMPNDEQALAAINKLHESMFDEKKITVNEARPKTTQPSFNRNRY